jgi:hypothetical protein
VNCFSALNALSCAARPPPNPKETGGSIREEGEEGEKVDNSKKVEPDGKRKEGKKELLRDDLLEDEPFKAHRRQRR